jgi:hypothetical protein
VEVNFPVATMRAGRRRAGILILDERSDRVDTSVDQPAARGGAPEAGSKPKLGRISVNVTPATQAALDRVVEREGVTVTEALRRLVGYGDLVYETTQVDGDDLLIRREGVLERIRLI